MVGEPKKQEHKRVEFDVLINTRGQFYCVLPCIPPTPKTAYLKQNTPTFLSRGVVFLFCFLFHNICGVVEVMSVQFFNVACIA